jgi:hypothetical protein
VKPYLSLLALTPPTARQYLPFALIWLAIALGVLFVAVVLRLPERMQCSGSGRAMHCNHSPLAPEFWRSFRSASHP